ncbi:MAG: DUF3857 domain-containing protein [Bacteroidota bacterium]
MKFPTKIFIHLLLIFLTVSLHGQYRESLFREMSTLYPDRNYIQLEKRSKYQIEIVEEGLQITDHTTKVFMLLKSSFGNVFSQSVYSSEFRELTSVEATSWHLEGRRYSREKIREFHEKMNVDNDVFYDDVKETVINFPAVRAGSVIEVSTTHSILEPRFLPMDYLSGGVPIHELELLYECDRGVELDFIFYNADSEREQMEEKESGNKKIYAYRAQQVAPYTYEERAPAIRYYVPHLIPVIRSYQQGTGSVEVQKDIGSLYRWYYAFVREFMEEDPPAAIRALADSLTRNCVGESEKVTTLYQWVQSNINYIAFEYGLGGFIPRSPEIVLHNMYGDCKDNTSILYSLLKAAGVEAWFTWIGTTHLPYSYAEVPTPMCDNHMILSYEDETGFVFLDGTAEALPLRLPNQFIQGKEALIGISKDSFRVEMVPVPAAHQNAFTDTAWIELEGKEIAGYGKLNLSGYHRINFRRSVTGMTGEEEKQYVEGRVRKGNNKFILTDYTVSDPDRFGGQMETGYTFKLGSYANLIDDELFVNMNLYKPLSSFLPKGERRQPVDLVFNRSYENHYALHIPKGYQLSFLPENRSFTSEGFSYAIKYEVSNSTVWYHQTITTREVIIQTEQLKEWGSFIKSLEKQYRSSIILKKNE